MTTDDTRPLHEIVCLCGDVCTTTEDMAMHLWMAHDHEVPPDATLDAERACHAALVIAAGRAIIRDLSHEYHHSGLIRDHADPNDKTGWNVKGIETCDDILCVESLAWLAAAQDPLASEEAARG